MLVVFQTGAPADAGGVSDWCWWCFRLVPPLMLVVGVAGPLTAGVITSATIAFVYRASAFTMPPFYALLWGSGQTVAGLCLSFSRILATL